MRPATFLVLGFLVSLSACAAQDRGNVLVPAQPGAVSRSVVPAAKGASQLTFYNVGSSIGAVGIVAGSDGDVYFAEMSNKSTAAFAQFDPATKTLTTVSQAGQVYNIVQTPDGAIWGTLTTSGGYGKYYGSLVRIHPFSQSNVQSIPLPSGRNALADGITYAPFDRHVYFTDESHARVGKIPASGPYTTGAIAMVNVPTSASPTGISVNASGAVFFASRSDGSVYVVTPTGQITGYPTPQQQQLGYSDPLGVVAARDGNAWITETDIANVSSAFEQMTPAGTYLRPEPLPSAAFLQGSPPSQAGTGDVAFAAASPNNGVVRYAASSKSMLELPTTNVTSASHIPQAAAIASDGSIWFICANPNGSMPGPLALGHITFGATWSIFPGTTLAFPFTRYGVTPQLIGIGETGDSAPFRVTSSNIAVLTVKAVARMDHNFVLTPHAVGTATVHVTDANGVTASIAVTVN